MWSYLVALCYVIEQTATHAHVYLPLGAELSDDLPLHLRYLVRRRYGDSRRRGSAEQQETVLGCKHLERSQVLLPHSLQLLKQICRPDKSGTYTIRVAVGATVRATMRVKLLQHQEQEHLCKVIGGNCFQRSSVPPHVQRIRRNGDLGQYRILVILRNGRHDLGQYKLV